MNEKEAKVAKIVGEIVDPSEYAKDKGKQKGTGFLYNMAYWQGYNDAKKEIRNRLYKAWGIEIPQEQPIKHDLDVLDGGLGL